MQALFQAIQQHAGTDAFVETLDKVIAAPTKEEAFRIFREEHMPVLKLDFEVPEEVLVNLFEGLVISISGGVQELENGKFQVDDSKKNGPWRS